MKHSKVGCEAVCSQDSEAASCELSHFASSSLQFRWSVALIRWGTSGTTGVTLFPQDMFCLI